MYNTILLLIKHMFFSILKLILHVDTKTEAEDYQLKKRRILPMAYSQQKVERAERNTSASMQTNIEPIDEDEVDEQKAAVRMEIAQKINAMNELFIDLDENEIDAMQDIIADDEMDITPDAEVVFAEMGTEFPLSSNSNIDSQALEIVPNNDRENSPPANIETPPRAHSPETPSPSFIRDNMPLTALTTHNAALESLQLTNVPNIVDENDISSYLPVMQYHFDGKCIIVSVPQLERRIVLFV